jgi:glycosyltransferase involved in cell wall biosynthesis
VLPAYNEAAAIARTLQAMRTFLDAQTYSYEIVVASDGDDDTPAIVSRMAEEWPNLRLTSEPGRHGKGHGLRRGFELVSGEIVGFLDADYKTPIDEIDKILSWFGEGFDIVAGSRALEDSRIAQYQPWYRQVGSRVFTIGKRLILGLEEIRDTQCGFKFFTREAAHAIFQHTRIDGYMCDVEILWIAKTLSYKVKEVGITWRDDGDSRLELVSGNLRNIRDLLRIRFHDYTSARMLQPTPGIAVKAD